jgi:hypothetical protein
MIVMSIKMARQHCELKGIPSHIYQEVIGQAVKESLGEK